jgi:outer membrane protein
VEKFKMKKSLLVVALLSAFAPMLAHAEAGDIVVRMRATNVNPNTKSSLGETTDAAYTAGTALSLYGSATADLQVGKNTIPELDISYYLTKNIAAELILAVGTRHSVNVSAGTNPAVNPELGKVNLLPPTLTAQWHFNPDQTIDPYVGAGAAFVLGLDRKLTATTVSAAYPIRIDRSAFGGVLQAGFDVNLQDKWLINFDVKKIWVNTDVKLDLGGGYKKIDNLDLNPLVVSIGIGKKF